MSWGIFLFNKGIYLWQMQSACILLKAHIIVILQKISLRAFVIQGKDLIDLFELSAVFEPQCP